GACAARRWLASLASLSSHRRGTNMTSVTDAAAALQSAADKKNAIDSQLRDLSAQESTVSDQIGRLVANSVDPKDPTFVALKAQRDALRAQIEDLTGAEPFVAADLNAAELHLKAAQR